MSRATHLTVLLALLACCSCGPADRGGRVSSEPSDAMEFPPLRWQVPEGWIQATAEGMRLVTLVCGPEPDAPECAVFAFPGDGGGVEPNVRRWVGQAGLDLSEKDMAAFLDCLPALRTDSGLPLRIVDFTGAGSDDASLLGAIVTLESHSVFLKMTGARAALRARKDAFTRLCMSIGEVKP